MANEVIPVLSGDVIDEPARLHLIVTGEYVDDVCQMLAAAWTATDAQAWADGYNAAVPCSSQHDRARVDGGDILLIPGAMPPGATRLYLVVAGSYDELAALAAAWTPEQGTAWAHEYNAVAVCSSVHDKARMDGGDIALVPLSDPTRPEIANA